MTRSFLLAALALALLTNTASADCGRKSETCQNACQERLGGVDQGAARAGCIARCTADQAACVTQSAIDEAEKSAQREVLPWISRQSERVRTFVDEI